MIRRAALIAAIGICWSAAIALLFMAGLPDAAESRAVGRIGDSWVSPVVGAFAPVFTADGEPSPFTLSYPQSSPILLNFWATWCVPCRVEMPELQAFYDAHPTVTLIGVNLGESPQQAVTWARALGARFPLAFDPQGTIAALYQLRGQPMTVAIAPNGRIVRVFYGAVTRDMLTEALAPWL